MAADTYTVVVADHFHYQDPSERWTAGTHATESGALAQARGIVANSVSELARSGARGDALLRLYLSQGDDPLIIGSPSVEWSALEYAQECIMRVSASMSPVEADARIVNLEDSK